MGGSKEKDMGETRSRYANSISGMFPGADLFTSPNPSRTASPPPPAMLRLEFRSALRGGIGFSRATRYFNFTNSKTKIAHTPTVIGNSTNDASLSEPPRGSAYVRSIMARAVSTPTANLPFQFIPVRPRFPRWPSRFRKRQRFYTFVPLHGANFQSNEPYRRSEHLTPLSILPGAPSPPSCNVPS
jgi:hypothetical protein